jgi:transcriptional regulator with XRE-family HTH domain
VKDLLIRLGRRVHDLRVAKEWSQEEFAHVSGFHRTYIGQIERGEKNISFGNLVKISGVLGVTMSELLSELEVSAAHKEVEHAPESRDHRAAKNARQTFEIQKLLRRLRLQNAAMDRTMRLLEELSITPPVRPVSQSVTRVRKERPRGK